MEPQGTQASPQPTKGKTLGQAIDEVVAALEALPEGARANALRAVAEHLGLETVGSHERGDKAGGGREAEENIETRESVDLRSLKEEKQPASAKQMACLVAYYLESVAPVGERQTSIKTADLQRYFKQAGYPLPKRIEQLLIDAKGAGYFDSAPGVGNYKLNAVGYNLVAHKLPHKAKAK